MIDLKIQDILKVLNGRYVIFACVLITLVVASCSEEEPDTDSHSHTGVVTPVGDIAGQLETFQLGPGGGTFRSDDGAIEINIPAGALAGDETFGVQAVDNTAPQGVGFAYRLTPHDVSFQTAVSVSFYYEEGDVSFPDGLAVAFQDEDGIWKWPGNLTHDQTKRKVTIETTHFSDWTLFESMVLDPFESAVAPGEVIEIKATRVFPEDFDKDLLAPLVQSDPVSLGEPRPLEDKFIREWKLVGEGTLAADRANATYTAPGEIPETNPAVITLEINLRNGSKSFLFAYVAVVGCEITINGGPYSNSTFRYDGTGMVNYIADAGITTISFFASGPVGDDIMVYITYPGRGTGREPWTEEHCSVYTHHLVNDEIVQGGHMIETNPPVVHPGYVDVLSFDEGLGIVKGTFGGNFSIVRPCIPDPCIDYGTIEGTFIGSTN